MEEMNLRKMMKGLAAVDDMTWGMYAFSRDALRDKVDCGRKKEMIENPSAAAMKQRIKSWTRRVLQIPGGDCRKAGTQGWNTWIRGR